MNSRAITLIATIAVIGIVAVGAGYAYTAITVNEGNNATAKYVTLIQDDGAAQDPAAKYTFNASYAEYFDTATNATYSTPETAVVKLVNPTSVVSDSLKVAVIGEVRIVPAAHGYAADALPTLNLSIQSSTGFDIADSNAKLTYYLISGDNNTIYAKCTADNTWKASNGTSDVSIAMGPTNQAYTPVTLKLCYGYTATDLNNGPEIASNHYIAEQPKDLDRGSIVFKVEVATA